MTMKYVHMVFVLGVASAQPLDCHTRLQECIDQAIYATDPKDCHIEEHLCHDLQGHVIEPVCGTNYITYVNRCEFAKEQCRKLREHHPRISINHNGSCGIDSPVHGHTEPCDPNHLTVCIQIALVLPSQHVCNDFLKHVHCDNLHQPQLPQLHVNGIFSPVCGTDGVTYLNSCQFAAHRCQTLNLNYQLDKLHDGPCVTTSTSAISTGIPAVCPNNNHNLSPSEQTLCISAVQQTCTPHHAELICGSNGVEYSSFCEFHKAHCVDANVVMSQMGPCHTGVTATSGIQTTATTTAIISSHRTTTPMPITITTTAATTTRNPPNTATTTSIKDIVMHVFCQNLHSIACNSGFNVVCGSDGLYYPNECELSKAACSKHDLHKMDDMSSCHI